MDTAAAVIDRLAAAATEAPPRIIAIYLFGSIARGASTSSSDVDLAFLIDPDAADHSVPETLLDGLEAAGKRPVDPVVLAGAAPDLIHRVLRDGVLLLDRAPATRVRFEVQARNEFFDLEPIRQAYRATRQSASVHS